MERIFNVRGLGHVQHFQRVVVEAGKEGGRGVEDLPVHGGGSAHGSTSRTREERWAYSPSINFAIEVPSALAMTSIFRSETLRLPRSIPLI